ncbi:pentapeptide repeat-containing protein [Luteibacter anthropi]|uniref:pentapeptide repeat-containing protein n=1 Tax=Luteibacter anthropi TaxID=564369 RepID=UPI0020328FE9|nr:pentapeptide repeat-containing protein [Luteibacter anthropi]URX64379.1 pentapeptide repeat-containing protein [Luteibacter anthropi]
MTTITNGGDYADMTFRDIDAEDTMLEGVRFEACTFRQCRFDRATFKDCRFRECEFIDCRLDLATIGGSLFADVRFVDCRMLGIDWTRARWPSVQAPEALRFERCLLNDSSFFGLYLEGLRMLECRARDVDFTDADCADADFAGTDLQDATFRHTRLTGSHFVDAVNYRIDIRQNDIRRARFSLPEATSLLLGLDIELVE